MVSTSREGMTIVLGPACGTLDKYQDFSEYRYVCYQIFDAC